MQAKISGFPHPANSPDWGRMLGTSNPTGPATQVVSTDRETRSSGREKSEFPGTSSAVSAAAVGQKSVLKRIVLPVYSPRIEDSEGLA